MTKKRQKELLEDGFEYIVFNDTETTGVKEKDRILQTGHATYLYKDGVVHFVEFLEENIALPEGIKIGPKAASIHGLWYEDLEGCPTFDKSKSIKRYKELIEAGAYMVQHNGIAFDMPMLEKDGIFWPKDKVIDTMVIARHYNPTREDFEQMKEDEVGAGLQAMRFYFDFNRNPLFKEYMKAYKVKKIVEHTALSDILVLAFYFVEVLVKEKVVTSLADAARLSRTPQILKTVEWGGNQIEKGSVYSEIIDGNYNVKNGGYPKAVIEYFDWAFNNMSGLNGSNQISIATAVYEGVRDRKLNAFRKFGFDTTMDDYINMAVLFNPKVYAEVLERHKTKPTKKSPEQRVKDGFAYIAKRIEKATLEEDERTVKEFNQLISDREVLELMIDIV